MSCSVWTLCSGFRLLCSAGEQAEAATAAVLDFTCCGW